MNYEYGVVNYYSYENHKTQHRQYIKRLVCEQVKDEKPEESSEGGKRNRDQDNQRMEKTPEKSRHEQKRYHYGQEKIQLKRVFCRCELVRGPGKDKTGPLPYLAALLEHRDYIIVNGLYPLLKSNFLGWGYLYRYHSLSFVVIYLFRAVFKADPG